MNIFRYVTSLLLFLFTIQVQAQEFGEGPFSQFIIRGVTFINGNGGPPQGPVDIVVEKISSKMLLWLDTQGLP